MNQAVFGHFTYADVMIDAAGKLRDSGYDVTIFSPVPLVHEIEHSFGEKRNYIKYFTAAGALGGFFFGITLAFSTAALYVLPRSGREIFAIPPTLLISYETAILGGVLFTFAGFMLLSRLPSFKKRTWLSEIDGDSFGLLVEDDSGTRLAAIERTLKEYGASEVRRVEED